ncbi:hypothetical protein KXD40_002833 [Peronospora effusa]|uniref:Uncharacterized protein n=1 Tax=Peronospora effusa TaxID=542832 RepID=A0A3M6VRN8_9STRA|nr:hypothetical protein DD238_003931 [Peronospora effusa]UIZ29481.1 hypothetical protein KXD40_002833 [Peronospora effusa]CAI5701616.1 unnamed protein product [Peronospora effusa]
MRGLAPRHLLLILAFLSAVSLVSTADNAVYPSTPSTQDHERHDAEPSHLNVQYDNHDNHNHDHNHHHDQIIKSPRVGRFSLIVWGQALFATALVGAAPVVVLFMVPLGIGNQETQQPLLRVFLSFAAGGLLGDALLHLLPHSFPHGEIHTHDQDHNGHDHSHSITDLYVWLWTLTGILSFLMLEKFVRAQTGGSHGHSHGHTCPSVSMQDGGVVSSKVLTARKRIAFKDGKDDTEMPGGGEPVSFAELEKKPIAAAGYLNLAADFSHNFTDGLAIGATFLRGNGWTTTLAMLLHELPHEIGDFAILIQSGFTRREAMATQLLTAIGAMIGTVIGLLMEGAGDSTSVWISPFTAGGFIYIACTSVMPELLEDCSLAQSLKEMAAMCAGIGLMALIALAE